MPANQTLEVSFIEKSLSLRYSDDENGTQNWEYHPICQVVSITGQVQIGFGARDPQTLQRKNRYRWDDLLRIIVETNGEQQPYVDFDLNQVTNQPGWTKDQAGVQQAIADINTWVAACQAGADGSDLGDVISRLDVLIDQTDDLETIASNSLTELQDINLNTAPLEALLAQNNLDNAAILAELQTQTGILNVHTTSLGNIITAINTNGNNNVTELQAIQTQLTTVIGSLGNIDANTAPLDASLTAIEAAINNNTTLTVAELQDVNTNLNLMLTELITMNATLSNINSQFGGSTAITRVDISGNPAFVVAPNTYFAVQLIVAAGTVTDGTIVHPSPGVYGEDPQLNKTHPGVTFNGTGATAYVKLMS